jgi:hypothetical protein
LASVEDILPPSRKGSRGTRKFEILKEMEAADQLTAQELEQLRRSRPYGLSSEPPALTANRAALFVLALFKIFPPVLMAVVILGLLLALLRPAVWREELAVLSVLCAGHLAFLFFRLAVRGNATCSRPPQLSWSSLSPAG